MTETAGRRGTTTQQPPSTRTTAGRGWLGSVLAVLLLAASCGSDAESVTDGNEASASTPTTSAQTEAVSADEDESSDAEESAGETISPVTPEPESDPIEIPTSGSTVDLTTAMVGGLRLSHDGAHATVHEGDMIEIRVGTVGNVIVARPTWVGSGNEIDSVDRFVELTATIGGFEIESTGETMTVLGEELVGHRTKGEVAPGQALFPSSIQGLGSNAGWDPGPVGAFFLGEFGGGVLAVGVTGPDDASVTALRPVLDDVIESLELTTPDVLQASAEDVGTITSLGDPITAEPRTDVGGDVLTSPFTPVEPGTYDLPNLPSPTLVTTGEGWFVAPNFPGFVVFADLTIGRGGGPGDHDLAFLSGATGLHSLGPARSDAVAPVPIATADDVEAMLMDPPAGLVVSSFDLDADVGGRPAIQFELQVDPTADCTRARPCSFMFAPASPDFVTFVKTGYTTRFWYVPDVPGGLLVAAQAPSANASWIEDRALPLVESLELG